MCISLPFSETNTNKKGTKVNVSRENANGLVRAPNVMLWRKEQMQFLNVLTDSQKGFLLPRLGGVLGF